MATEGLPQDRVPQELRRQTISQLEEAIRNTGTTPANLQNPSEVEKNLFEQSRNADDYTAKLQRILFMLTKRKSLQNLSGQNPQQQQQQQQQAGAPQSIPQASGYQQQSSQPQQQQQQQQQQQLTVSYSASGSNMAGVNPGGMGMTRPMQAMGPGGGGGGYQPYQGQQIHPSQHTHYSPHMHRGVGGAMQPGIHRPMIGGQGMMHGAAYGHSHNPMGVPNYPQSNMNYQHHFNPGAQMHGMGMPQRQPSINPSLMRPQQPTMASQGMIPPTAGGPTGIPMARGGVMGGGGATGMGAAGRMGGAYGGPVMQHAGQGGFTTDMSGSVQSVMAVPNPSYLPSSSAGGIRQPAPPYDSVGAPPSSGAQTLQPPTVSSAAPSVSTSSSSSSAPGLPPPSSVPPSTSSSSSSSSSSSTQPQTSVSHSHPSTSSSSAPHTTASTLLQSQPVPSPAPPPTPLLPASPATSISSPAHSSSVTPEENEAYLRTHHELQVYLPLLTRMMNRTLKKEGEDAQKSEQYMKLKSLHSLLQDDKKRVPLPTLIKCKTALEKMFEQQQMREHLDSTSSQPPPSNPPSVAPPSIPPTSTSSSSTTLAASTSSGAAQPPPSLTDPPLITPTTRPLPEPKSQSLLEFKMIPSPTPTLGNLIDTCTVRSHPFPADRLPPSKRLCNRSEPAISPGLRREIAHLVGFKVQRLPVEERSRGTVLECSIVDEDLPTVPSLTVRIPPGYPDTSPECDLDSYGGGGDTPTPLLSDVGKRLAETLACCCDSYTLSFLLSSWETSLLKALSAQF